MRNSLLLFCCIVLASARAGAYDLATHARLSQRAIAQSTLAGLPSVGDLGFGRVLDKDLGNYFLDIGPSDDLVVARAASGFEISDGTMPGVLKPDGTVADGAAARRMSGWIMRGTIREDDGIPPIFGSNPADDPLPAINRFCNHFYDPKYNTKLQAGICLGDNLEAAPAWALGSIPVASDAGPIARPMSLSPIDAERRNHYTLPDAREAMWRALTLRSFKDATGALQLGSDGHFGPLPAPVNGRVGPYPFSTDPVKAARQYRDAYWATTFYSLGTMLHLNQDMAQPQHTRHEIHPVLKRKEYERYIEARALFEYKPIYLTQYAGYTLPISVTPLSYDPANGAAIRIPAFTNVSDFWSTNVATGAVSSGLGLADFSNSRFFTLAHNLGDGTYPEPSGDPTRYITTTDVDPFGYKHLYLDAVSTDPLGGPGRQVHMTRPTFLNDFLSRQGFPSWALTSQAAKDPGFYTLDWKVYDDQAGVLLPKAVAYSAGLINWFFRGRLAISAPDEGVYALVDHALESNPQGGGFATLKLKIANATAGEAIGAGYLVGIVKFHRDTCYTPGLSPDRPGSSVPAAIECRTPEEETVLSKTISITGIGSTPTQFTLEFADKLPINATDIYLQAVFRGQLGNESDAVVVGTRDLFEPTFIAYVNSLDYITFSDAVYTLQQAADIGVQVLMRIDPPSCVQFQPVSLSDCFNEDPLSLTLEFGSRPARITVDKLAVRQYFRFAFLADSDTTVAKKNGDCQYIADRSLYLSGAKWQIDGDLSRSIVTTPTFTTVRGVNANQLWFCRWLGDGSQPLGSDWMNQMMTLGNAPPQPIAHIDF